MLTVHINMYVSQLEFCLVTFAGFNFLRQYKDMSSITGVNYSGFHGLFSISSGPLMVNIKRFETV